jgi:leucyl/phenylalanyl-tRNA--protein transferase
MVFRLPEDQLIFPNPALADEDGLLAVGGDLSVPRLLLAYQNGIFPWFSDDDPICWYAPHERCVIYPKRLKISKSMAKIVRSNHFTVTYNTAFEQVISNCANVARKDQPGTWITNAMQKAYLALHKNGFAKSIEIWQEDKLVGGLYGVEIKEIFCGESMFSLVSNASKMAMISLCQTGKYTIIDCQLPNDHLISLGAEMISSEAYRKYLKD